MFGEVKRLLRDDAVETLPRSLLADRFEQIRGLRGAIDAYEARLITATASLDDRGLDGAAMLRSAGRVSSRSASQAARRAEGLEHLPATRDALAQGRITVEHVDSIVTAARTVSPEQADGELVERAAQAPADVFLKDSREWATRHRPDDGAEDLATQRRNRSAVKWVRRDNEMRAFYSQLDRVDGDAVHTSLQRRYDELLRDDKFRDGAPDDVRTPEQRMADAFVSLITGNGRADLADRMPHPRYHVNVVYDIAEQRGPDRRPLASLVGDGRPLPAPVLERIACDATVTPMIFDGPARPLWQGTDHRAATIAQWKALIARDRGCVGCGAAPNRCEAHHIVAWAAGGPTDIDNLVLVCSRCHHDLHDRQMVLRRREGCWCIENRAGPSPPPATDPARGPDDQLMLAG